jgi:GTP-binding protein HflX
MLEKRTPVEADRALIVGLYDSPDPNEPDLSLDELAHLVDAAGGVVVGRTYQRRGAINPATFLGKGKAEHVGSLARDLEAKVAVFDNELSPAQIRELERIVGIKVIDRSELILDIFASRARTRVAMLQVELAQLEYTSPRLRGMWTHLERQAGTGGNNGLGMKGPGEKQIEIDRRIVQRRITRLKDELSQIYKRKQREVANRISRVFTVGLVGYTNAGKSTLMNALTDARTYTADKLFATLDTKTRRWQLAPGTDVALSDTVGFVQRLPHHLVASFRSTLEEALNADLLLHVIDASHPQVLEQIAAVEQVLSELGCEQGRLVPVLNKIDIVEDATELAVIRSRLNGAVSISALNREGLDELSAVVTARRRQAWITVDLEASAGDGKVQAFARSRGLVHDEQYDEDRWQAVIELPRADLPGLKATGAQVRER